MTTKKISKFGNNAETAEGLKPLYAKQQNGKKSLSKFYIKKQINTVEKNRVPNINEAKAADEKQILYIPAFKRSSGLEIGEVSFMNKNKNVKSSDDSMLEKMNEQNSKNTKNVKSQSFEKKFLNAEKDTTKQANTTRRS